MKLRVKCPHQALNLLNQFLSRDSPLEAFASKSLGEEASHLCYLVAAPLPIWSIPGSLSNFYPNRQQYQLLVTGKKMGDHRLHLELALSVAKNCPTAHHKHGSCPNCGHCGVDCPTLPFQSSFPKSHRKIA